MRLHHLAPLCLLALTPLAQADTFQFTYTGVSDSSDCAQPNSGCTVYNIGWQLSSTPDSTTPSSSLYNNVAVASDYTPELTTGTYSLLVTQPYPAQQNVDFYDENGMDDATIFSYQNFFTGPASDPVFVAGTYGAGAVFEDFSGLTGDLTVTDLSTPTSPTPEPSTLALLGTGVFGTASLVRRRMRRYL